MLCRPIYNPPLSREGRRGTGRGRRTGRVDFLNTLESFLFVRDSGRHWGITSSFLPGSSGAAPWVPANLIVKPSIERSDEYDEKRTARAYRERREGGEGAAPVIVVRNAPSPSPRYRPTVVTRRLLVLPILATHRRLPERQTCRERPIN